MKKRKKKWQTGEKKSQISKKIDKKSQISVKMWQKVVNQCKNVTKSWDLVKKGEKLLKKSQKVRNLWEKNTN